ncbi:MAG: hypothetical protein VX278_03590, partial [Myxococcota bacterium]|nr:hypothetical protein [Myxococcota bacterium]
QPAPQTQVENWKGILTLQERMAKGMDWKHIADSWSILDEEEAATKATKRFQIWLQAQLEIELKRLRERGLNILPIKEKLTPESVQEWRDRIQHKQNLVDSLF